MLAGAHREVKAKAVLAVLAQRAVIVAVEAGVHLALLAVPLLHAKAALAAPKVTWDHIWR